MGFEVMLNLFAELNCLDSVVFLLRIDVVLAWFESTKFEVGCMHILVVCKV